MWPASYKASYRCSGAEGEVVPRCGGATRRPSCVAGSIKTVGSNCLGLSAHPTSEATRPPGPHAARRRPHARSSRSPARSLRSRAAAQRARITPTAAARGRGWAAPWRQDAQQWATPRPFCCVAAPRARATRAARPSRAEARGSQARAPRSSATTNEPRRPAAPLRSPVGWPLSPRYLQPYCKASSL